MAEDLSKAEFKRVPCSHFYILENKFSDSFSIIEEQNEYTSEGQPLQLIICSCNDHRWVEKIKDLLNNDKQTV